MNLPNGWKEVKLGDVCSLLSGQDYSPDLYGSNPLETPYITGASNFSGNHIILNRWTNSPRCIARKGDILLVCKGSGFGTLAIADFDMAHIARQIMAVQDLKGVDRDFLFQIISMNFRIIKQKGCGLIPGIDRKSVLNISFNLPPLAEQKKIAEILSVWDSAIDKMEKLIKFKEANKKRLISTLIDFAAESKKNITNTIKIDGVIIDKSKWRKCKLSEIASGFEYGMNAAAKEYDGKNKYIRITDIDENTHRFNAETLVSPNGLLDKKYLVNSGDILFARTGASTGKSYLYNENDGLLYYAGFLIRVNIESENSHFIYLQTLTSDYQNWVKKMSARSGQPGINAEEYKELPIVLPSRKEQDAISNYLTKIEKEILLLTQQLALYKKQKQGLMQKLLTGEWRVK